MAAPDPLAPLLSGCPRDALAATLCDATRRPLPTCTRIAARAHRLAFRGLGAQTARWSDAALKRAGIGARERAVLLAHDLEPSLTVAERAPSADGSVRLLLRARDDALIEAVIIPAHAGRDQARTTLCVSSQVGCARACTFCETAALGLSRQLSAAEIVDQYRVAQEICRAENATDQRGPLADRRKSGDGNGKRRPSISNLVFMGMGEPLDNLEQVVRAIAVLTDDAGIAFAASRITVSTVGVADKIAAFFASCRAELAVSLNAPDDARRGAIMPINRRFDLTTLRRAITASLPRGRRVLFQYALFSGFNDSPADADLVADFVAPVPCRVNVIPANPGPDPQLVSPPPERVDAFIARLKARGVTALVRAPRGRDVGGACGQLAGHRRLAVLTSSPC